MENYKIAALVVGIIGIFAGLIIAGLAETQASYLVTVGAVTFFAHLITLILFLAVPVTSHKVAGWISLAISVVSLNLWILIPAIMAIKYKTDDEKFKRQTDPLTK
jgi:hypothetical protein